ncbi:MAG: vWA domain-containing protein [Bacteroidia bacterium]
MISQDFKTESPENYEQKCCCVLVLDVSGSMNGDPINELNEGLKAFYRDIQTDSTTSNRLEVSIITFNDYVKTLIQPSLASNFTVPNLLAEGGTKLVDGVREGIKTTRARKTWYKETGQPYYRPWVILITDADPDNFQSVKTLSIEIKDGMNKKDFFFLAIGVQGADMLKLKDISDPSMPAMKLKGLKFSEFFKWLSASMTTVTNSKDGDKVNLPNPADWMVGFTI